LKFFVIGAVTLIVTLTIALIGFESTTPSKEGTKTQEVTLKIDGTTCKMCSLTIKTVLERLDGVSNADVSYKDKQAKVSYEGSKVSVVEMIKAIKNAGNYKVSVIK